MITEDYVNFETAKLLKERGFDENTPVNYFVGDDKLRGCVVGEMIYHKRAEEDTHLIACPTLQMTMKWLREVHRIVIMLYYANVCGLGFTYVASVIKINDNHEIEEGPGLDVCVYGDSYEEACEAAIKYCLENLI